MNYPEEVVAAVREAVMESGVEPVKDDVNKQIARARLKVRAMVDYHSFLERLGDKAIQEIVYNLRHVLGKAAKKADGLYSPPSKLTPLGESEAVSAVCVSFFDHFYVGGYCIGNLTGGMLAEVEETLINQAGGLRKKAKLIAWLRERNVSENQMVRDAVKEKALKAAWARIDREACAV